MKADRVLKDKEEYLKEMESYETDKFERNNKIKSNDRRKNDKILST